jgi:hypothetical protein
MHPCTPRQPDTFTSEQRSYRTSSAVAAPACLRHSDGSTYEGRPCSFKHNQLRDLVHCSDDANQVSAGPSVGWPVRSKSNCTYRSWVFPDPFQVYVSYDQHTLLYDCNTEQVSTLHSCKLPTLPACARSPDECLLLHADENRAALDVPSHVHDLRPGLRRRCRPRPGGAHAVYPPRAVPLAPRMHAASTALI